MSTITKLTDRFTEASIDDEIVVMRVDTGEFFSLAGTAAEAWTMIDGSRDRDRLLSDLAAQYATAEGRISADVDEFLGELKRSGLLADA